MLNNVSLTTTADAAGEQTASVVLLCRVFPQGDIQQLLIVGDPGAAEAYCQDYIPDCDAPLPYNNILTEAEEVRDRREA